MNKETKAWFAEQLEAAVLGIFEDVAPEVRESYSFQYHLERVKAVQQCYKNLREKIKQDFYPPNKHDQRRRIDQHKIAACYCAALIENKIFSFETREDIPESILFSNYQLAYTFSLWILYICLIDRYRRTGNWKLADKLVEQQTLYVPETTRLHDTYHMGRIKTLALNDYYRNGFDLLTYADTMYWIEHYNRQLLEGLVLIEPDSPEEEER